MTTASYSPALIALGAASLASVPAPAAAQADRAIVMSILWECSRISDSGTRTACYDNNIRMAGPASGGTDPAATRRDIVMNILVECARIDDQPARMSCYDKNMRDDGAPLAASATPAAPAAAPVASEQRSPAPATVAAPVSRPAAPQGEPRSLAGFGGADSAASQISPMVAAVSERGPGAYLLTLQDGTQWEFLEDVPPSYRAPEPGSTVRIDKGAFGNFRLRFDQQQPVRVRRVR